MHPAWPLPGCERVKGQTGNGKSGLLNLSMDNMCRYCFYMQAIFIGIANFSAAADAASS